MSESKRNSLSPFNYRQLSAADAEDEPLIAHLERLCGDVFALNPFHRVFGLTDSPASAADLKQYCKEGLSWVCEREQSDNDADTSSASRIVGFALCRDLADVLPSAPADNFEGDPSFPAILPFVVLLERWFAHRAFGWPADAFSSGRFQQLADLPVDTPNLAKVPPSDPSAPSQPQHKQIFYLSLLGVSPKCAGGGIAKELVSLCVSQAKQQAFATAIAVASNTRTSHMLCKYNGFAVAERFVDYRTYPSTRADQPLSAVVQADPEQALATVVYRDFRKEQ